MKEAILSYLEAHRKEMLSDICDLVRIDSEKMQEKPGMPYGEKAAEVLELALEKAKKYGFFTRNYDNYVGCVDMNTKEKQLDILAHLDVVGANPKGWKVTQPFEPKLVDGCIYGRGTADDKGPAIAALYAMRAVKELGFALSKNVRLILGCDEECNSSDIAYYYAREAVAPMTFSPDACFPVVNVEKGHWVCTLQKKRKTPACDETQPRVLSAQSGIKFNVIPEEAKLVLIHVSEKAVAEAAALTQRTTAVTIGWEVQEKESTIFVTCSGVSGHAASPEHANNALTGMLAFLQQECLGLAASSDELTLGLLELGNAFLHGDYAGQTLGLAMTHEVTGPLTISLNMLTLTQDRLEACFDSRMPLNATPENTTEVVRSYFEKRGFTVEDTSYRQTHYVPEESAFVQTLLRCYEMYSHKKGFTISMGGGTYVHNIENGVAFGCVEDEDETNLHGNDEHIAVEDLIRSSAIFAQAIVELCR